MSEEEPKKQPVIVVKKKGGHGGHHGGAWKVAYADFVTAMMAFFLVMWLVAQSDAVKQAVQAYFQDPAGFMKGQGKNILKGGESPVESFKNSKPNVATRLEQERESLSNAGERIQSAILNSAELQSLKDFVEIEMIPEGLRIQLIESDKKESHFFDLGSARLKDKAALLLKAIAQELGQLPNYIVVEGHTDSKPYNGTNNYTNWELSADRANSARKLMDESGLRRDQIVEIRGNADRIPKIASDPLDPRNRRVAIIVLNDDAAARYAAN
nr:OmpA family protein [candidate division Zixibacteria bacterium]